MEHFQHLKKLIPYEFDPKYVDFDHVKFSNVVIKDPNHQIDRIVKIDELIVLVRDDKALDQEIFIREAVIDPSIFRDSIYSKIKNRLFAPVASQFDNEIKELSDLLSSIKIKKFIVPKIMKTNKQELDSEQFNKRIDKVLDALQLISFPLLDKRYTVNGVTKEIKSFEEMLESELKKLNIDNGTVQFKLLEQRTKQLSDDVISLKSQAKSQAKITEEFKSKIASMSTDLDSLDEEIKGLNLAQEHLEITLKNHEEGIQKIVDEHTKTLEEAADANSVYGAKIKDFIKQERDMRKVQDEIDKGGNKEKEDLKRMQQLIINASRRSN